jgi:hypothetical protein
MTENYDEVDVDELEKNHENSSYQKELIKKIMSKRAMTTALAPEKKPKKPSAIKFKTPRMYKMPVEKVEKVNKKSEEEVFQSMKSSIYEVMAIPMKPPEKKPILKKKLMDSEFMNHYLKNSLYDGYLRGINNNLKFLLVYSYHFMNTHLETGL